jgi:aspartyl-tRNA(Asn)/glutamyl-tRNA(Gln) amidotransferase subunit C
VIDLQVDEALLQRLEKLSALKIADEKREEVIGQLDEIVAFVDNLSELNTDGLDPRFTMEGIPTHLREDDAREQSSVSSDILAKAQKSEDDYFIVQNIIE